MWSGPLYVYIISTRINPSDMIRNIIYNFALMIKWNFLLILSKNFLEDFQKTEQPRKEKENTFRSIDPRLPSFEPTVSNNSNPHFIIFDTCIEQREREREIISSSKISESRGWFQGRDPRRKLARVSRKKISSVARSRPIGDYRPPTLGRGWPVAKRRRERVQRLWACVCICWPRCNQEGERKAKSQSIGSSIVCTRLNVNSYL